MEFFLLVAALSVTAVLSIPWVLAYSRRQQTRGRWPQTITRTHTSERTGAGAYRARSVDVERVVSVETGAPSSVARGARQAFSAASAMFIGGVLCGAWVPVSLWLGNKIPLHDDLTVAYGAGFGVAVGWMAAALSQFHAAWDRWEPSYDIAASETAAAFRLSVLAAIASLAAVGITRAVYGVTATLVPLWFSLYAVGRAVASARSLRALAPLYARAEANEHARRARVTKAAEQVDEVLETETDDATSESADEPSEDRSGVRVVLAEGSTGEGPDVDDERAVVNGARRMG
ncbi:MAG: hypothetical protein JNK05_23180 [Myxococcales bacterium]|nr:hypothetical protein [Myxococcales bacterium]